MTPKAKIVQHPERAVPEAYMAILQEGKVAHVGFCQQGQPYVIPFMYHYDSATPDRLYLHGAAGSRAMRYLSSGVPLCVEVTLLDGLVYSRTAHSHSANYRSAVCFGKASGVADAAVKEAVFGQMILRYFPGRTAGKDYQAPLPADLNRTVLLEVAIEHWSAKARRGGPKGPDDSDDTALGSAGVIDL